MSNFVKPPASGGKSIKSLIKHPIPVAGLQVGMYVCELDRPWEETPFLIQGFRIKNRQNVDEISGYCDFVYIEITEQELIKYQEHKVVKARKKSNYPTPPTPTSGSINSARTDYTKATALTRSFMDDVRLGRAINMKALENTVSDWAGSIIRCPEILSWVSKIRQKDTYTSDHCMNVGILGMVFGRHLGADVDEMKRIGLAGLLHDVGKMRIPDEILNKEGALTAEEYRVMCLHPKLGRDILIADKSAPHTAIDVCYGHHESLDGTGYPRKVPSSGISDLTRMITICDVYDAITSDRIYKKGQSSYEAVKVLYDNRGTKFDSQLVEEFIKCVGLYPAGSIVELRNREIGIVVSTNYVNRRLPKVLVVRGVNKRPCKEKIVNLQQLSEADDKQHMIHTVLPNGIFGIRIEKYIENGLMLH